MRRKHHKILVDLLNGFKHPRAAEIGVSDGPTSEHLLRNCPNIHLLMVDVWSASRPERNKKMKAMMDKARKRTNFAKTQRRLIKLNSLVAAADLDNESLNLVFIDASHRTPHVLADCAAWWPKLKAGGILCGHDAKRESVQDALHLFANLIGKTYKMEETVWMITKP